MDALLINGDVVLTDSGETAFVKGIDEMLQKAILCAKISKGSFVYNKDLGTEISEIDINSPQALITATVLLNEVLIPQYDIKAEVESLKKSEGGNLDLLIAVKNEEEIRRAQVTINAEL